jgi:DNA-damage-inducible protein D
MVERRLVLENLPPAEDVKKLQLRLASEDKKILKNKDS